jgi:PAS domain S-box-containing protein
LTAEPPPSSPRETSEERYRAFIEQTSEGVWRCELREPIDVRAPAGEQIDAIYAHAWLAECNDAMARMYGLESADDIVGTTIAELMPRDDPANLAYLDAFIRSGYRLTDAESHEIGLDGRSRYFLNNLVGIVRGGLLIRAWGSQRDITARKEIESALRASEERYRALVTAGTALVWTADAAGRFAERQASWERYTGQPWAAHRGVGWTEALHPDDREGVRLGWRRRLREPRQVHEDHVRLWSVEKSAYRHVVIRAVPVRERDGDGGVREWIGTVSDVEEHWQAEDRLRRTERMETVGRLAGGIAHEANNQMSVILGSAEFVLRRHDIPDAVRDDVEHIHRAAERTAGITRQLLAFSRRQVLQPQVVDLNALLHSVEPILRRTLGERSQLAMRPGPGLGRIRADPGQLEQVLLNLVLNARDAMPQGGRVTIETSNVELTPGYGSDKGVTIVAGPHVLLSVADTGVGMDAPTAGRAFEPFFTTKPTGEGTGLGLATVYGIVKQSGGYIWLYSEAGQGTTFKIYLPVVGGTPAGRPHHDAAPPAVEGETVLLVEDESDVRGILGRVLRGQGYLVLEAPHGRGALELAADPGTRIDLVVADVVMPELGGRELAARLAELGRDVPVLFISGYTGHDVVERGLIERDWPFLPKPVAPDALARKVRELLDG